MKRILVVDDQPNIRRLVEVSLRSANRQILQADSGEKAIEMAQEEKPDLIIMDLVMPGEIDGMEAVEMLKADLQTRDCSILVLTARNQDQERERALQIGVDDFMIKPFKIEVLQKRVSEILT